MERNLTKSIKPLTSQCKQCTKVQDTRALGNGQGGNWNSKGNQLGIRCLQGEEN